MVKFISVEGFIPTIAILLSNHEPITEQMITNDYIIATQLCKYFNLNDEFMFRFGISYSSFTAGVGHSYSESTPLASSLMKSFKIPNEDNYSHLVKLLCLAIENYTNLGIFEISPEINHISLEKPINIEVRKGGSEWLKDHSIIWSHHFE